MPPAARPPPLPRHLAEDAYLGRQVTLFLALSFPYIRPSCFSVHMVLIAPECADLPFFVGSSIMDGHSVGSQGLRALILVLGDQQPGLFLAPSAVTCLPLQVNSLGAGPVPAQLWVHRREPSCTMHSSGPIHGVSSTCIIALGPRQRITD